ncbi:hypothetical protein [Thermomonospora catenispora]|uniref:hypothetical protein n=1 Tax=Thermomonospora catenispora TaxID=2493090 RepID=UPI00111F2BEA|nr:hypothetical protein [Thermomonospora catenispora]TNY36869.1 hypothetical protein EIO00_11250 [Thermomonospora catenispora]
MTGPGATTTNYAGDSAFVGVQAATVHDVHIYSSSPDASPAEKFEIGVSLLDGGVPGKARQLIREAVMAGLKGNRVCFHWQLALVSGRARQEMPDEDLALLRRAPEMCQVSGGDAWADGVKTVCRLLEAAQQPDADLRPLLKDFDGLGDPQRSMILRHLELFLEGSLKDQMWHRATAHAREHQMARDRSVRVWKFFEPDPIPPRTREPLPPDVTTGTWVKAAVATAVFTVAVLHIGYLLVQGLQGFALLAYLASIAGGYGAARSGLEWRFRIERIRAKDAERRISWIGPSRAPAGGFARKVDQRFSYYFGKYLPRNMSRDAWMAETAGIRKKLRDEIVDVYREKRIGVERIIWLIRHQASTIRKQWENGTLWSYRQELATPLTTKALTIIGLIVLAMGAARAVESAIQIAPVSASRSVLLALLTGAVSTLTWKHILLERRRYKEDCSENDQRKQEYKQAYERWREKLTDAPSDPEMAAWLDCDRKVLLDEALRHYGLTMSDMIAYAFIESPVPRARRACVKNGPLRYTRYRLLLFLLTTDGVRQLSVELDFEQGTFHGWNRTNYRYESVAAVRVHQKDDEERRFELALVNGERINAEVMVSEEELDANEPLDLITEATLDASGIHHTLHVMEGVAAEGKKWLTQERRRRTERKYSLR